MFQWVDGLNGPAAAAGHNTTAAAGHNTDFQANTNE